MNGLLLVRHARALSNDGDLVNGVPPGGGLSPEGVAQAHALATRLHAEPIALAVSSRLLRARETLELALGDRDVPREVEPLLDEISFGSFEGGPLADYRAWAWSHGPAEPCPGDGESRADAAARIALALETLLGRQEETILAVGHALVLRYVLDAAGGSPPARRVAPVAHATPYRLEWAAVERAASVLRAWALEPSFADTPSGG